MYTLHNKDCLQVLANMADNSVDLVATDPPYFQVKQDAWDNQWETEAEFLKWLEQVIVEYQRVLRPTGSLYLFASPKMSSKVEAIIAKHMKVENHIVWVKPTGMHKRQCKPRLRRFFPATERIIFASQKGFSEATARHKALANACEPLISYFRHALTGAGLSQSLVNAKLGTKMAGHWFGRSQWQLPNKRQYTALQQALNGYLIRDYHSVKAEYERLINNRQNPVKRPFKVGESDWYTDIWECQPVQFYEGKHPCEKPALMMEHIIQASSNEGDVVLDSFMGRGTTGIAAVKLGRRFIGCEMGEEHFLVAKKRIGKTLANN